MVSKVYSKAFADAERSAEFIAETMATEFLAGVTRAMDENGLSQRDLADILGKKPALVSRVLAGPQNVTLRTVAEFMVASGLQSHIVSAPLGTSWSADKWTNFSTFLPSSANEVLVDYTRCYSNRKVHFSQQNITGEMSSENVTPLRRAA